MQGPQTREGLGVRVAIAALLIAALAGGIFYTIGPLAGTLVAIAIIAFGAWALLRTDRQEEMEIAPPPSTGGRRLLIVADGRAPARALSEAIARPPKETTHGSDARPTAVRLIIPAPASTGEQIASATDEARAEAERRLKTLLADLRLTGVEADGEVGDPDPVTALEDGLRRFAADEVLIQTASGEDGWRDLLERAAQDAPVPVRTVPDH